VSSLDIGVAGNIQSLLDLEPSSYFLLSMFNLTANRGAVGENVLLELLQFGQRF
jgi:hypothetical protein